jgi:hypothetical protein
VNIILSSDLGTTVDLSTEDFARRCDVCNGPLKVLGSLGNLDHSKCVDCGCAHVHAADGELIEHEDQDFAQF